MFWDIEMAALEENPSPSLAREEKALELTQLAWNIISELCELGKVI